MKTSNLIVLVTPAKENLVDYTNAVAKVNSYAYAITQTSLPVLNQPPQNYADFTTEFTPAKANVLVWTDSIFANMLAFPQVIVNAEFLFDLNESNLQQTLTYLKTHPDDAKAKNALNGILTQIQENIKAQITAVEDIETTLNKFATQLGTDAATLSDLAKKALDAAGADQSQIAHFISEIDKLNDDINKCNKLLTVAEIGIAVSIFVDLVGIAVAVIPGAQVAGAAIIIFGLIGLGSSIAGAVVLNREIQEDKTIIDNDRQQISQLNQDVIALQAVNKQFEYLLTANQAAQEALTTIKTMWTDLDNDLADIIKDLTDIGTDVTSADYAKALTDLTAVQTAWNDVVTFAEALQGISYKWQDKDGNWHNFTSNQPAADSSTVTPIKSAA
jgi:hypothetical protein